jgi:chromosome segregation ATPase
MGNNVELVRLEEFVDKLLTKYNQLKSEYHLLQDALRQRDAECAELKNNIFTMSTERTEVGNRVAGLLDRIEQWESDQTTGSSGKSESLSGSQGSLFADDSEPKHI